MTPLERYRIKNRDRLLIEGRDRAKAKREKLLPLMRERGAQLNAEQEKPDAYISDPIVFKKCLIVKIPWQRAISKNYMYGHNRAGGVYIKDAHRATRDSIHYEVLNMLRSGNVKFNTGKVWLDIFVEKPDHRGDAVNTVDAICDGVKGAIGIDDRWYSIRRLDWIIVKDSPMITIKIGQENDDEQEVCYFCGRVRPIAEFNKRKQICVTCRKNPLAK